MNSRYLFSVISTHLLIFNYMLLFFFSSKKFIHILAPPLPRPIISQSYLKSYLPGYSRQ